LRNVAVAVILPVSLLVLGGCKTNKPLATPESALKGAPPAELDVTLQTTVARQPSFASLEHDATAPRRPGDAIRVTAKAVVPSGHRVAVQVEGTDFRIPVSPDASADVYRGSAAVPSIPPGAYKLRGTITAPDGQVVAQLEAATPISIIPKMAPCEGAQAKLADLRIPFDYDKSDLGPRAKELLASVAEILRGLKPSAVELTVEGHCDERGTVEYNLALGNRRAAAVGDYLVDLGAVDRERARKVSYGKERPRNPGQGEAAWAENRRAEFRLGCESE